MNIDDLKTAWSAYDRKLRHTQALNEKIIISMISERSQNRFSQARKEYVLAFVWMVICLGVSLLVIWTNPFDYIYTLQFVPVFLFVGGITVLLLSLATRYLHFQQISITHHTVGDALKAIIAEYEKPRKFVYYTIIIFLFSQVVLFPLSFLPRNIEEIGFGSALIERLIPITIGILLIFAAYKLGAFKERHLNKFKEDLSELQTLKKMSDELQNEQ